jgi:histidine ammonia-lyase
MLDSAAQKFHSDRIEVETLVAWARSGAAIRISDDVRSRITDGNDFVRRLARSDALHYGINTGFGALATRHIGENDLSRLQHNLLKSHACGVGESVDETMSRLVTLIKLMTFRTGMSGVSLETVDGIVALWNAGLVGVIPKKGTVGASGDLAPLAHLFLPLIGLGEVWRRGERVAAAVALREAGIEPLKLGPKDALCLTNGVQYLNAQGAMSYDRATRLVALADICAAMSMEGFAAARSFIAPELDRTWGHPERIATAARLRTLLSGSNHADLPQCHPAMEDPYSFRCIPQVHGAVQQVIGYLGTILAQELACTSDNPVVFADSGTIRTCGNLHGQSIAFALDFAAIGLSELASISERRTYQLLSGQNGLPSFLIGTPGVNSGFMIVQYTSAALVNENKVLATPASIDTIPTCQLQEDHVSMGGTSAHKLETILENCETVLAIELMTACQAIDLAEGLEPATATGAIHAAFRRTVPKLTEDALMAELIGQALTFVRSDATLEVEIGRMRGGRQWH